MTMAHDDDDLDRLLRGLPAPGVPPEAKARHLEQLRAAMAESANQGPPDLAATDPAAPGQPATSRPTTAWTRRRRVVIALSTTGVVLVGGTAAAAIAWERASVRNEAHCYPFATTDFANAAYGPEIMDLSTDTATAAIQICSVTWAQGLLRSTPPYEGLRPPVPATPPELFACVLPDGAVGVFPILAGGKSTCAELGLPQSEG